MAKGDYADRKIRSLRDAELLINMRGKVLRYQVRMPCLHGILHARSIRLLRSQMNNMGWLVQGMDHLEALVVVHTMLGTSTALLDRVIREAKVTPVDHTTATPDPDDPDRFSDGEVPSEGRRTSLKTDEETPGEGLGDPAVALAAATHESADGVLGEERLRDPALPLFLTGFRTDEEAPGEGLCNQAVALGPATHESADRVLGEERHRGQPFPEFRAYFTNDEGLCDPALALAPATPLHHELVGGVFDEERRGGQPALPDPLRR
ncbi:hypothetical protein ZWY2020_020234 [Hordeum vulgare]|nr:hypothetical protein ZWY2020_020234 [Hordeum vulgare]